MRAIFCCIFLGELLFQPIRSVYNGRLTLPVEGFLAASSAFRADIRADTNRDGVIDLIGDSDAQDKTYWTQDHGAIFLPNIGDTDHRCSKIALGEPDLSDEDLAACNDASDDVQRAPQFLAPLKTIPILDLPSDAFGQVSVPHPDARRNVRIFRHEGDHWIIVHDNETFSYQELTAGLDLGIDARDVRRPGGWDGRAVVRFSVHSDDSSSTDEVMLRVAPILAHHNLEPVEQVLAMEANDTTVQGSYLQKFTEDLDAIVQEAGVPRGLYLFSQHEDLEHPNKYLNDEIWTQDFMEPGYVSMPGPNGPLSLRVMIRSPQDFRDLGRDLFARYRGPELGAVQQLGGPGLQIDSTGNIEAIPPYTHNGQNYPAGRLILGTEGSEKPFLTTFFQAQELQDPIFLDAGWLGVGHIDEFVQFLPAKNERGWIAMVNDPRAGLEMLHSIQAVGYASLPAISRQNDTGVSPECGLYDLDYEECTSPRGVFTSTIGALLADPDTAGLNERAAQHIDANIEILKRETGISDAEILRLPCLVQKHGYFTDDNFKVGAYFPNVLNGLVLSGWNTYVAPKPYGPVVDGIDVLAKAVSETYAKADMRVHFVDDWNTHHPNGEVHCGTNSFRDMSARWW